MKKAIKVKEQFDKKIIPQAKEASNASSSKISEIDWQKEINDLKGTKFASLNQALDSLITAVLKRMKISENDLELRERLKTLLETDPYVIKLLDPKYKNR